MIAIALLPRGAATQIYDGDIASVASSVMARMLIGPVCDVYGGRRVSSALMIVGAIPAFFLGFVQGGTSLTVVRFFIGFIGELLVVRACVRITVYVCVEGVVRP